MKYIKTFESFDAENFKNSNLNEGLGDMFMGFLNKGAAFLDNMMEWAEDVFGAIVEKITGGIKGFIEKIANYFKIPLDTLGELSFRNIFEKLAKNNAIQESEVSETHVNDLPDGHWMKTKIQQQSGRPHDNSNYNRMRRERDMEDHMDLDKTKDIGQKVLSVLTGIFGVNMIGGIPALLAAWLTKLVTGFDIAEWALSQEWIRENPFLKAAFEPGNRGFFVVTLVYSVVAMLILMGIKKADAYLATSGRDYGRF
jgi:hypothetical protein